MWYKEKGGTGAVLKSIELLSTTRLYISDCSRPLVYLLDNSSGDHEESVRDRKLSVDSTESSPLTEKRSFVLKLQTELDEDDVSIKYVTVKPMAHKTQHENEDDAEEEEEEEGEEAEDDYGEDEEEQDNDPHSGQKVKGSAQKTGGANLFKSTFNSLMTAGKLVTSLNTSAMLGIQYYSFVIVIPGNKDIVVRTKRVDQLILWINTIAEVSHRRPNTRLADLLSRQSNWITILTSICGRRALVWCV